MTADVHLVSAYGFGGSSTRVRLLEWAEFLGIDAVVNGYAGLASNRPRTVLTHSVRYLSAELQVRRLTAAAPSLVLSREATPFSRGNVEARLLRSAPWSAFDLDDAIYLPSTGLRRLVRSPEKAHRAAQAADVVIAGSETLADWAAGVARDVRLIPSCVEPDSYRMKTTWELAERPVLVWLGSPSTEQYIAALARPLRILHARTGMRLKVISGPHGGGALSAMGHYIDRVPWDPATVAQELRSSDVAIGPLRDDPFSRGKCAYKLLQYASTGLPMVGSPVGANAAALRSFDGIAATGEDDWVEALESILNESSDRRRQRGTEARRVVKARYSFAAWESAWRDATQIQRHP